MTATIVRVHRIDDQRVIQTCREVMQVFADNNPQGNVQPIPGINKPIDVDLDDAEFAGKYTFDTASVNAVLNGRERFHLTFTRTIRESEGKAVASALYNEFQCDFGGGNQADWQPYSDKIESVQEILGAVDIQPIGVAEGGQEGVLRELLSGFGATHRSMLESLDQRIKAAEDRRQALDEEYAQKVEEQRKVHEEALEKLESERSELERQSYKAERRKGLRDLTNNTASRLKTSIAPPGAIWARWGVFVTALLISGVTAAVAYTSFIALGAPVTFGEGQSLRGDRDRLDWILLARAIISSIISVGALVYAASWLRGFYNADLLAAQEVERFTYDLNRANWVIETILEVQQEQDGQLPDAWVEGVTRGLFDNRLTESSDDAAKALSALLGYTASASFGPAGPQFDIKRRGAGKLSKGPSDKGDV